MCSLYALFNKRLSKNEDEFCKSSISSSKGTIIGISLWDLIFFLHILNKFNISESLLVIDSIRELTTVLP